MSFDRDDTLKKAEKLLRQGRLDAAILEYERVVENQPRDWGTANTLGDLYVRAGQVDKAVVQYSRMAEHFRTEGFYSKAAALYKKLLKLRPQDEGILLNLADVSQTQGLLADAKLHLNAVAAQRRSRGDSDGADEIAVRLGSIDPADFDARRAAARRVAETGDPTGAASRFRALYEDLAARGRDEEALDALHEAVRLDPADRETRGLAARAAVAARDLATARLFLDREIAGRDPDLLLALLEIEALSGRHDQIAALLRDALESSAIEPSRVLDLAWSTVEANPEGAYSILEAMVTTAEAVRDYSGAAKMLREFAARVPEHIPALLRLIEVCVDAGFEPATYEAQALLADAYLRAGHAAEARVIAEDLIAREPWENSHIDRFRRALVMLKVSDPDRVIADRLSGQSPFAAADLFPTTPASPPSVGAGESGPAANSGCDTPSDPVSDPAREHAPGRSVQGEAGTAPGGEWARQKLEQAFNEMRSGVAVADQPVEQMTLARRYREMGMTDAAIESLERAVRATQFRFEAASLLGRIHMERGETALAIDWLERAAEAPAPTVDESRALLYDLATLFEATGEPSRALAICLELQSDAGEYRDVAARIDRLTRADTGG